MKVMAITNFGPGIKVHMLEEPQELKCTCRKNLGAPRRNLLNINQYSNQCVKRGFGVYKMLLVSSLLQDLQTLSK